MAHHYEKLAGGVCAPEGFTAGGVPCGIKKADLKDLALIRTELPASAAALYTSNRFQAAPIHITREHLGNGSLQGIVVNSGNANACTGARGLADARRMAQLAAQALGAPEDEIAVASTGVIGSFLPMDRVESGIKAAAGQLVSDGSAAAEAILTTDTFPKETAISCRVGGAYCTLGGMAKGAGMIRPDLATMLAFITTDAIVSSETLRSCLARAVNKSFNMISVDGCMSTNDMVLAMANGTGQCRISDASAADEFTEALASVCCELARLIVKDAEGATKFVTVRVYGGKDFPEAKTAAMAVADSNLLKTALFGRDANWGRVAAALGAAGLDLNPGDVDIYFGNHLLLSGGEPVMADENELGHYMEEKDLEIRVDLGRGPEEVTVWTSDLSYDYIRINAEYRS